MRNRPLASGCLIGFLLIMISVICGGAGFIKNLCPSVLENTVKGEVSVRLSGQLYDIDVKDNYQILYLKNNSIIYQNESFEESRIIVYDEEKLNMEIGNQIEVSGKISFYEEERNPGNFNQKLYYLKQGIHGSVWASDVKITDKMVNKFFQTLYDFRMQWKILLNDVLGEEDGALLSAMLLADKSGINEDTKELYQANGVGHILAISGLHLSVIGVGLYQIFRRLSGSFVVGGTAGISFLILYILMIGLSVSVLRALIMFLFRVGAEMTGRHYDSVTALLFSALVTVIWNPLYILDGGFWLSYGAVLAMILVLPIFENLPVQGFWASISINIVTVPVLLYYFYEVPLYSPLVNMIIVPLMSVVLLLGLSGSLCCAIFITDGIFGIQGIGGILMGICRGIFRIYEVCCELSLKLPGARVIAGQPKLWQIVFYYGVLLVCIGVWWYQKNYRKILVGKLFLILFLDIVLIVCPVAMLKNYINGEMSVTVLDVGQGDGIFIRGPEGNTYLIDGGSSDVKKVGKYRIEPFLKSQGIGKIDYVFVSHGDSDHISGIREMIERKSIGASIETIVFTDRRAWDDNLRELARFAKENKVNVMEMKAGQAFAEGEMQLTCLAPGIEGKYDGESNMASMVLALAYGEFHMLLTGDVEGEGEVHLTEVLEDSYQDVSWEILKVAHHGSRNSSAQPFLNMIMPSCSIISAGRENSYGHPHEETIDRLENVGSKVLSTQECGAITIVTNGKKMRIGRYLEEKK